MLKADLETAVRNELGAVPLETRRAWSSTDLMVWWFTTSKAVADVGAPHRGSLAARERYVLRLDRAARDLALLGAAPTPALPMHFQWSQAARTCAEKAVILVEREGLEPSTPAL